MHGKLLISNGVDFGANVCSNVFHLATKILDYDLIFAIAYKWSKICNNKILMLPRKFSVWLKKIL